MVLVLGRYVGQLLGVGNRMKKNVKCDKCSIIKKDATDGSEWNEFSDNYKDTIRTYWLCEKDDKEARLK